MCVVSRASVSYAYTYFYCSQQLENPNFVMMSRELALKLSMS